MRRRSLLLVFALLVLSGCAIFGGPSGSKPAPQQVEGPGWRLIGMGRFGEPYRVYAAADEPAWAETRASLGLPDDAVPPIDWSTEFIVVLVPAVSGSCPDIRFDGLDSVPDAGLLHGRFTDAFALAMEANPASTAFACTADANPSAFVLAVERAFAPGARFTLRLEAEERCAGCEGSESLEVDRGDG